MKTWKWFATASALALSVGLSTPTLADVSIDDVLNDAKTTKDVVTAGLGGQGQRYSPLKTINKDNVAASCRPGRCRSAARRCAARRRSPSSTTARCSSPAPTRGCAPSTPRPARALEVRAPPARGHHALLRRRQPRRRADQRQGDLRHARRAARRARPGDRRRRLEGEDRRLQGGLLEHRRADHRPQPTGRC